MIARCTVAHGKHGKREESIHCQYKLNTLGNTFYSTCIELQCFGFIENKLR
jgi:hypothetical protein